MKKRMAIMIMLALVNIPNMTGYKAAVAALGKLQNSGIKIETNYKPVIIPEDINDPENPIYGGRDYNY